MSGDWIKMRADLQTHPKVVRISSALRADRLRIVGGLHAVWCLFDAHSVDGRLDGYTSEALDSLIGFDGFSAALASVGWLEIGPDYLETPRFDEHNGQSAKRRAQETERKRNDRKLSAPDADKKRSREEKRREEIQPTEPSVLPVVSAAKSPRPSRKCPERFVITAEMREWAAREAPGVDADAETLKLRDHTFRNAITDWPGAWRNWLRRAYEHRPPPTREVPQETPHQRSQRERMSAFAPGVAARAPTPQRETIDVLATRVD